MLFTCRPGKNTPSWICLVILQRMFSCGYPVPPNILFEVRESINDDYGDCNFTVVCWVMWPMSGNEVGVGLFWYRHYCISHQERQSGLYQNRDKVSSNLKAQRSGHWPHNCKLDYILYTAVGDEAKTLLCYLMKFFTGHRIIMKTKLLAQVQLALLNEWVNIIIEFGYTLQQLIC